jgi:hypothetical protein
VPNFVKSRSVLMLTLHADFIISKITIFFDIIQRYNLIKISESPKCRFN